MNKPKIIDLFCGVGGLSQGFEDEGYETILAIDNWSDAIKTYNNNRKNKVAVEMNIHNFDNEKIDYLKSDNEIVGVIGGPPCQGYSTVGTRNIDDPRNHLYLEYCKVVERIDPKFFVIENVKGLLTLNNGMFREDIIKRFSALGFNVSPKIVNAADYGVPQNRLRVFFVGVKKDEFVFPQGYSKIISTYEALSDLPNLDGLEEYSDFQSYVSEPQNEFQERMRENSLGVYNHNITNHSQQTIDIISMIKDGGKISDLPKEYWEVRKYNKAFQRMNSKLPSNTIDTGHRNYFHYKEDRIPSVRESARLQSFKDTFIFSGSKTSQYKQVGNAVPPLLSKVIARELLKHI